MHPARMPPALMLLPMRRLRTLLAGVAIGLLACMTAIGPAAARGDARDFAATLSAADRAAFEEWFTARTFYDAQKDAYWDKVVSTRSKRRRKIRAGGFVTSKDYVTEFPPEYDGPKLSASLENRWEAWQTRDRGPSEPSRRRAELPGVDDFLRNAEKHYDFVPERISEAEFKRRYAREALRLGLSKEQVVRVYALETGGIGTADMQAGIHPISKKGRPISSALGYAQLLNANSTSELAKHGEEFIERLRRMQQSATSTQRKRALDRKIVALKRMVRKVKSFPFQWSRHQSFANTGPGLGVHAINLDGDIGPWLQVIKLRGVKDIAAKSGRTDLDSTELELMNLAGPGTGLEMMTSVGLKMPTVNFFSRGGYERNSVVRGRISSELLDELGKRMDGNQRNSGAREFERIFDELLAERRASR